MFSKTDVLRYHAAMPYALIPKQRRSLWLIFLIPVVLIAVTLATKQSLESHFGLGPPLVHFLPAVLFSTLLAGYLSGLTATVGTALLCLYWFMPPHQTLAITNYNDWIRLGLFSFSAVSFCLTFEYLSRQRAKLIALNQDRERFIGVLVHELRVPIHRSLLSLTELSEHLPSENMREGLLTSIECLETANTIISDVEECVKAANNKMAYSKQAIDIDSLVRKGIAFVLPEAKDKNVFIAYEGSPDTCVFGDSTRLLQVVWNLLRNAIRASSHGAQVVVKLRVDRKADSVLIEVVDQGVGIRAEQLERIFEPYIQAQHRNSQGLGLGLSVCKSIVEAHGGSIRAQSSGPGEGARFEVSLPLSSLRPQDSVRAPPQPVRIGEHLKHKPVLLVEDDEVSARILKKFLTSMGVSARIETHVSDARQIPAHEVSCVITDLHLHDGSGWTVLEHFKKQDPNLKVICLSGESRLNHPLRTGFSFDTRLTKPVSVRRLLEALSA